MQKSGHSDNTSDNASSGEGDLTGEKITDQGRSAAPSKGMNWLRHAGVGPSRKAGAKKKIFGTDITSLGSLEAEIMGLLWEISRPANGMEVAEAALYKRRGQGEEPIAFSTVNTTLRRLADKGLLTSEKSEARTPYYAPTVGREEMAARILNNVSETLLGNSLHGLIPKLIGGLRPRKGAADDQEMISRLLDELRKAAESSESLPIDPASKE